MNVFDKTGKVHKKNSQRNLLTKIKTTELNGKWNLCKTWKN